MKDKLVSVIIPTFNRAYSVVDAVKSVQNQSYPNVQIIVVDDGSADNTASLISGLDGVEYYYQENKGQGAARNLGLKYARGEYIASLDSDDIWHTEFLAEGVSCLEKDDLDCVFLNWKRSDGNESTIDSWSREVKRTALDITERDGEWLIIDPIQLRRIFLGSCIAPTSAYLLRRDSFSKWNEEVNADDWVLILEMIVSKPCRAAVTTSTLWFKRVFNDNIYEGRDVRELLANLDMDVRILRENLYPRLSLREKLIYRAFCGTTIFKFSLHQLLRQGVSRNVVTDMVRGFILSPIGVTSFVIKRSLKKIDNLAENTISDRKRAAEEWGAGLLNGS